MHEEQDIKALVQRHIEAHRSSLSDEVYRGIRDALKREDLQGVHDLLVKCTFEIFGPERAKRVLGEVDAEITILKNADGPLH